MLRISFRAGVIGTFSLPILFFLLLYSPLLQAGRPLITDDADVVGKHKGQLELWVFGDKNSFQHWMAPALGIGDSIDITASAVQGTTSLKSKEDYSITGPILQAKLNIRKTKLDGTPGLAFSFGGIPPLGIGSFSSPTWEYFYYLAGSSYLLGNEDLLFHVNLGRQTKKLYTNTPPALLWGIAFEVRLQEKAYLFLETANGEIYALIPGVVSHIGVRYALKKDVQIDGSIGKGVMGDPLQSFWGSLGLMVETDLF